MIYAFLFKLDVILWVLNLVNFVNWCNIIVEGGAKIFFDVLYSCLKRKNQLTSLFLLSLVMLLI